MSENKKIQEAIKFLESSGYSVHKAVIEPCFDPKNRDTWPNFGEEVLVKVDGEVFISALYQREFSSSCHWVAPSTERGEGCDYYDLEQVSNWIDIPVGF